MSARAQTLRSATPAARASWRQRWHQFRNRLVANPAFQRWATRNPLTRPIANKRATQLHHMTAGFVYSQTLLAFIELELPETLAKGPVQTEGLVTLTGVPEPGLLTLLKAARALGLLEYYPEDLWGLGELGAALLANPGIAAMVKHHRHLYLDLSDPSAMLQRREQTALSAFWAYGDVKAGSTDPETYSELMATSQGMIADYVLDAVDLRRFKKLVDVAGGTGAFARRAVTRFPNLNARVFDLPAVAHQANAQPKLEDLPVLHLGGDMFADPLPDQADVLTFVRVLHDHDDEPVQKLLDKAHEALDAGGQLIIAEPMAETPGSDAIGHTYFGLYLWAMGSGRPRTAGELKVMMENAGFANVKEARSPMPVLVRVLVGEKINA